MLPTTQRSPRSAECRRQRWRGGHRPLVADVAIRLSQLTKRFGGDAQGRRVAKSIPGADAGKGFLAVDHIDLEVREGEFFSLLGPSGCGKTTTLRMIGGFEQPTSGRIELQGQDVT